MAGMNVSGYLLGGCGGIAARLSNSMALAFTLGSAARREGRREGDPPGFARTIALALCPYPGICCTPVRVKLGAPSLDGTCTCDMKGRRACNASIHPLLPVKFCVGSLDAAGQCLWQCIVHILRLAAVPPMLWGAAPAVV